MIWIPYLAQEYLKNILHHNMRVFEYGCGDSTIFFSTLTKQVFSVEHDREWYDKIAILALSNVSVIYCSFDENEIGQDKSNPEHYKSGCITGNFQTYVNTIDDYGKFDLIFIDGRARASCLKKAFEKQADWVVLDNTERSYYQENVIIPDNYEIVRIFGHGPRNTWPWETTFYKRRNSE